MRTPALFNFCLFLLFFSMWACQAIKSVDSDGPFSTDADPYVSIARVEKDGKVGYINGWGEEVLPVEFDEGSFQFYDNRITVRKEESWYIYDVQGNLLLDLGDRYKYVGSSGNDLIYVAPEGTRRKSNRYDFYDLDFDVLRFIDLSGKEALVIDHQLNLYCDFPSTIRFQNGFLRLYTPACPRCANRFIGFADKTGKVVVEPAFHDPQTISPLSEGLCFAGNGRYQEVRDNPARFGFIDTTGTWAIEPTYLWLSYSQFVDGAAIVDSVIVENDPTNKSKLSNTFLIDHEGKRVFPRDVHIMRNTHIQDSIVVAEKYFGEQLKFALAKTDGTFITDFKFDFIIPFRGQGHYTADIGNDRIYINKNGEQIHAALTDRENQERDPTIFSRLSRPGNYVDGLSLVYLENKETAVIDMDGHIIATFTDRSPQIEGGIIKLMLSHANSPQGLVFQYYDRKGRPFQVDAYDKVFEFKYLKLE